jgi:hypothetical protein
MGDVMPINPPRRLPRTPLSPISLPSLEVMLSNAATACCATATSQLWASCRASVKVSENTFYCETKDFGELVIALKSNFLTTVLADGSVAHSKTNVCNFMNTQSSVKFYFQES